MIDTIDMNEIHAGQRMISALRSHGFMYVKDENAVFSGIKVAKACFDDPNFRNVEFESTPYHWGFVSNDGEQFGSETPDNKESFDFETPAIGMRQLNKARDRFSQLGLSQHLISQSIKLKNIAQKIRRHLCVGLGTGSKALDYAFDPGIAYLRLLHYPETAYDAGIGEHTDYGFLTLVEADQPGLEIEFNNVWIPVDPKPGYLIVNIGDLVDIWTSGALQATKHRVRRSGKGDRYSVAFFYNPDRYALIKPIIGNGPSVLAGEHIQKRYNETFTSRKENA